MTVNYNAWGTPQNSQLSIRNSQFKLRYLLQGREYSHATALYNFRARWYSSDIGRWLSKDPIGLEGGLNLYVFCGNNPVNYRDPFGKEAGFGGFGHNSGLSRLRSNGNGQKLSPHREIKFAGHVWIKVPEYDGNQNFTGQYYDLNFNPNNTWWGGSSDYNVDFPVPGLTIYHDFDSTPKENYDLLQNWRKKAKCQPEGSEHSYDFLIDNCISITIREHLKY